MQPLSEISSRAHAALVRELGVADALRFLNQFRTGRGNYTAEREQLFQEETVQSIVADIRNGNFRNE